MLERRSGSPSPVDTPITPLALPILCAMQRNYFTPPSIVREGLIHDSLPCLTILHLGYREDARVFRSGTEHHHVCVPVFGIFISGQVGECSAP